MKIPLAITLCILATGCGSIQRHDTVSVPAGSTKPVTNSVYTISPQAQGVLDAIAAGNAVNPTPTKPLIDLGLTVAGGVLGLIAALKTKKAAQAQAHVATLAQAIEEAPADASRAVKAIVARKSAKKTALNSAIQNAIQ